MFDRTEYNRAYYQCHKDKIKACVKLKYGENRSAKLAYAKNYRLNNAKKVALVKADWFQKNKERVYINRKKHPEKLRDYARLNRARRKGAIGFIKFMEWLNLVDFFDGRCAYCGVPSNKLEPDHVLPISRGGTNTLINILPACRSCNAKKKNKTLGEWNKDWKKFEIEKTLSAK